MAGLSVVVPVLNEARHLPFLLADLQRWPDALQIVVVDGGSTDKTIQVAHQGGAQVVQSPVQGRGQQLQRGLQLSQHSWLMVLHADSRLSQHWVDHVQRVLSMARGRQQAWAFDFRVDQRRPMLKLLEWCVALRSRWGQMPYGDQGLLIHRSLYERVGGYRSLALMEDVDLIQRLQQISRIGALGCALTTSARRWNHRGVLNQAWNNAQLRRRWKNGEDAEQLIRIYRR
ncbi:TIGR04283 family arsenosugar biosynthesis glycosyltransferase [bacterium]|nr:TIGR04283 family arsenosugar biosynthesis glycosyltransferase [bacterium]